MTETISAEKTKSILIVDDEPEIRAQLAELLSERYKALTAASAEEALHILSRVKLDLIITDIMMPGMSGLESIPHIRHLDESIPIVVISGVQTIESAIKALRAGAHDYIMKPYDLRQVEVVVRRALEYGSLAKEKAIYDRMAAADKSEVARLASLVSFLEEKISFLETPKSEDEALSSDETFYSWLVHDMNNELSLIGASLHAIQKLAGESAEIQKECDFIQRYLQYTNRLLQRAKSRVGIGKPRLAPVRIQELTSRLESLLSARVPADIQLNVTADLTRPGVQVFVDLDQILGVFIELTNNAVNVMRGRKGTIDLEFTIPGEELVVIVKNNGPRITGALREQLFHQQVETSKEKGMGLGLKLAAETIKSFGGTIGLRDSVVGWTEFEIKLPLYNPLENS